MITESDLRVPGYSPNSRPEVNVLPSAESPDLIDILNSVPPDSMRRLQVSGQFGVAGKEVTQFFSDQTWLLHPAGYQKFLDLMVLYTHELPYTTKVIGLDGGRMVSISLKGTSNE